MSKREEKKVDKVLEDLFGPLDSVEPKKESKTLKKVKDKAELSKIEKRLAELELAKLEIELAEAEIDHKERLREHRLWQADEQVRGSFRLQGPVESQTIERLRARIVNYAAAHDEAPITLVISSPGGEVFAGWVLYDTLRTLSEQGHHITTVIRGVAGSMAGILSQAGDLRLMGAESYLVIHEASSMAWGKSSELQDEAELLNRLSAQGVKIYAKRSTLTAKEITAKTHRKDWWIDAKEAKKHGFIDRIG